MKEQIQRHASSNPIYGMGFIGALVYYLSHAKFLGGRFRGFKGHFLARIFGV